MDPQRMMAMLRVADAKRDLKDWEDRANAILTEMESRRPVPQNPQTHADLGEVI